MVRPECRYFEDLADDREYARSTVNHNKSWYWKNSYPLAKNVNPGF